MADLETEVKLLKKELEDQAKREFNEILSEDYQSVIWKENTSDWRKAEIVVSTVQSFISKNKFWPSVSRIDNAHGDRNLFCSCIPVEEYQS